MPDFYNRVCRKATNELICFTLICCAVSRIIYASRKKKCADSALCFTLYYFAVLGFLSALSAAAGKLFFTSDVSETLPR